MTVESDQQPLGEVDLDRAADASRSDTGPPPQFNSTSWSQAQNLLNVVEAMRDGVCVLDRNYDILYANPSLEREFGPWKGKKCYEYFHGAGEVCANCRFDKVIQRKYAHFEWTSARTGKTYDLVDTRVVLADGRPAKLEIFRDVTDVRRAADELRRSEELLNQIVSIAPVGLVRAENRRLVWMNRFLEEMLGFESRDEWLGKSAEILYASKEEFRRVGQVLFETARRKRVVITEAQMRRKDGTVFPAELRLTAPLPDNPYAGVAGAILDLTETKTLKAQLYQAQKMEALGALAGGVAHDFNNLLTIITGYSELLLSVKGERDPDRGDLQKIYTAAQRGAELVKRLLIFSRKGKAEKRAVNLGELATESARLLERTLPKMITIRVDVDPSCPLVNADPSQMDQIIMNLAVNARDAMPEGGVLTIAVRRTTVDERFARMHIGMAPGEYVTLQVSDDGVGMEKAVQERIFEPFFSTKPEGKGTGLGLATVYGIVKQHEGHVYCESEPGKGTTFSVFLPVNGEAALVEADKRSYGALGGSETVLVVDDEEFVLGVVEKLLSKVGYTVLCAKNGREALEVYRNHKGMISLVILDLVMPVMDGQRCLRELLKLDPNANVLIASGQISADTSQAFMCFGANGILTKPYNSEELLSVIREALDRGAGARDVE
jgi:PAS domain S-box-containing protein